MIAGLSIWPLNFAIVGGDAYLAAAGHELRGRTGGHHSVSFARAVADLFEPAFKGLAVCQPVQ